MKLKVFATLTNVSWKLKHSYINGSRKEEKLYHIIVKKMRENVDIKEGVLIKLQETN